MCYILFVKNYDDDAGLRIYGRKQLDALRQRPRGEAGYMMRTGCYTSQMPFCVSSESATLCSCTWGSRLHDDLMRVGCCIDHLSSVPPLFPAVDFNESMHNCCSMFNMPREFGDELNGLGQSVNRIIINNFIITSTNFFVSTFNSTMLEVGHSKSMQRQLCQLLELQIESQRC